MDIRGTTADRDGSVDAARALAIVAIVVGHVERGLFSSYLLPYDTALTLDRLLYLFHLSTFAYLSGLFVRRAVERDGWRNVVRRRTTLLVWLYLLWTVIQGVTRVTAAPVSNTAITVGDVARLWVPEGQLWFLPWLIAVTLVAALAQPWHGHARTILVLGLAAALALAVWGFEPLYAFTRGWALLLPFLVGCVVTHRRHVVLARRVAPMGAAFLIGAATWLWVGLGTAATTPTTGGDFRDAGTVGWGLLGCVAGTVATLALAALLARSPLQGVVSVVGRRSLEIFLAHIVVTAGTRIALLRLGVTDVWVHVIAASALGLAVPIALAVVAERLRWTWLFGLPSRLEPRRFSDRRPSSG